jgi:hypothetical protein
MNNPEERQHWVHTTQDQDKQNKKHNTDNYKDEQHEPHQIPGMNPGARER